MRKGRSVINVLALCILIVTFIGDILLHILQKEKIVTKNRPCSRGLKQLAVISFYRKRAMSIDLELVVDRFIQKFQIAELC